MEVGVALVSKERPIERTWLQALFAGGAVLLAHPNHRNAGYGYQETYAQAHARECDVIEHVSLVAKLLHETIVVVAHDVVDAAASGRVAILGGIERIQETFEIVGRLTVVR